MDPVSAAIMRINKTIPKDILKQTFMPKRYDPTRKDRYFDNVTATSVDDQIRSLVIDGWVGIEANFVGGIEMNLPMHLAEKEMVDSWNMIYRFGREATGGRRIIAVYEMTYGMTQAVAGGNSLGATTRSSDQLLVARDIIRATSGTNVMASAYVQLVGINTVLVNDINQVVGEASIRCKLSHEANFNDIKPNYYLQFSEMVVLAVKAYIYNTLVIELDEGQIRGGMALGRIREIVDSYADAGNMYYEYLTGRWQKIMTMNDTKSHRTVLKNGLGAKPLY